MQVLAILVVGFFIGVFAAAAPLGPVTLMVLRRALKRDFSGAMAIGLGRIPAELLYVGVATFGMSALLERFPDARIWFSYIGAVVLMVIGTVFIAMRHHIDPDAPAKSKRKGFWAGFLVSALNPTLIVSWSAISAIALSTTHMAPDVELLVFPVGVGTGIAAGYALLVWTVRRWGGKLKQSAVTTGLRTMGAIMLVLGVYQAVQATGMVP